MCSGAINIAWFLRHLNLKFTPKSSAMPLQVVPVPTRVHTKLPDTIWQRHKTKMSDKKSRAGTPELAYSLPDDIDF